VTLIYKMAALQHDWPPRQDWGASVFLMEALSLSLLLAGYIAHVACKRRKITVPHAQPHHEASSGHLTPHTSSYLTANILIGSIGAFLSSSRDDERVPPPNGDLIIANCEGDYPWRPHLHIRFKCTRLVRANGQGYEADVPRGAKAEDVNEKEEEEEKEEKEEEGDEAHNGGAHSPVSTAGLVLVHGFAGSISSWDRWC
jgi:hypothetical protein